MNSTLTEKERYLLEDQKKHEELCIQKYNNYSEQAQDPELKQLFKKYAEQEQQHYNTIDQILQGNQQSMSQGQMGGQGQGGSLNQAQGPSGSQGAQHRSMNAKGEGALSGLTNQEDGALCNDMLMTEKYISGSYDTAIFESTDQNLRQTLQHIQKEEQQHGEGLFNYMQSHGMYNTAQQ